MRHKIRLLPAQKFEIDGITIVAGPGGKGSFKGQELGTMAIRVTSENEPVIKDDRGLGVLITRED